MREPPAIPASGNARGQPTKSSLYRPQLSITLQSSDDLELGNVSDGH